MENELIPPETDNTTDGSEASGSKMETPATREAKQEGDTSPGADPENFSSRIRLDKVRDAVDRIEGECRKFIVGQPNLVNLMLTAILADGHILIEGVPGVAKTLTAKTMARTISADFARIQFTPDLMPSDIIGTNIFNVKKSVFEFRQGPIFANIVLIDEINRAPAKTQAALFEVMEEKQITVDGHRNALEAPFIVMATQNPVEHEGTYRLPEAQLDRFLFKINIHYPQLDEEVEILTRIHREDMVFDLNTIRAVFSKADIQTLQELVRKVHIEADVLSYIAKIVNETRRHPSLFLGGSTRASIAILKGAKAFAAIQARDFVTPEDVQFITEPALNHRLSLAAEREMEGLTVQDVIKQIIQTIDVPR